MSVSVPSMSMPSMPLATGTWVVDKTHSAVRFSVRHLGISKVRGRFTRFDATAVVGTSLADTRMTAVVEMASVNTDNAMRDQHLRGPDFFDVEQEPVMTFESTSISARDDDGYDMAGALTINGVTREEVLVVEALGVETFPGDGSTHAGFSARGSISRADYGIEFNVPMSAGGVVIGDRVDIELDVQLMPSGQADAYHAAFAPAE
ncbi:MULTISPECIES: YceI family protein [unclassified Gordonia (in: high G+C Gram-positive bacteria)]